METSRKFILEYLLSVKALPREERDAWGIMGDIWGDPRWTSESCRIFDRAIRSWPKYTNKGRFLPVKPPYPHQSQDDMFNDWLATSSAGATWSVWTVDSQYADDWEELLDHMIDEVQHTSIKGVVSEYLYLLVPTLLIVSIIGIFVS